MTPKLEIDLANIKQNAANIVEIAAEKEIKVWGVTKGAAGDIKVAEAMLAGGVVGLADSRLRNLKKLTALEVPLMLLRIPQLSEVDQVIKYASISLNSELQVIKALDEAAKRQNKKHKVILMVDLGDRREGILPETLLSTAKKVNQLSNVDLTGLGTNLACFRGLVPDQKAVHKFNKLIAECENNLGINFDMITAGNSSSLPLLLKDDFQPVSSHYRVGETILLGREVPGGDKFPLTTQETFTLTAEIIEVKDKPTQLTGQQGENAFGKMKKIEETGNQKRAILAIGRQDISPEGVNLINEPGTIIGASSDHLVVDVTEMEEIKVGDKLQFKLEYSGLLRSMTSPYVEKVYLNEN